MCVPIQLGRFCMLNYLTFISVLNALTCLFVDFGLIIILDIEKMKMNRNAGPMNHLQIVFTSVQIPLHLQAHSSVKVCKLFGT